MKITLNQVKIIGVALLALSAIYFHVSMTRNSNKVDSLLFENSKLANEVAYKQIAYDQLEQKYIKLDSIDVVKTKQLVIYKRENADLQLKLANLDNNMVTITPDSSYTYIMQRYLPMQDSLPYGFAPNQVKSIHRDILAFDITKDLNVNLKTSLDLSEVLYSNMTSKFNICNEQKSIVLEQNDLLDEQLNNYAVINKKNEKKVKLLKTASGVLFIAVIVETAILVLK
jgi:hypothetical protein